MQVERSDVQAVAVNAGISNKQSSANQYKVSVPRSKAVGASSTSVLWVPSQSKLPFAPVPRLSASQGDTIRSTTKNLLHDDPMAFFRGPTSSSSPSTATASMHNFSSPSPNLKRARGPVVAPDPKRQKQMDATSFRQNVASVGLASISDRPQPRPSTATLTTIASNPSECFVLHPRYPLTLCTSGDMSDMQTYTIP